MVRGTVSRMVRVKAPDERLFQEAIFILRDSPGESGVSEEDLLREASAAAAQALPHRRRRPRNMLLPLLWAGLGALLCSGVWLWVG